MASSSKSVADNGSHEPLDKLTITISKNGTAKHVQALHCGWVDKKRQFTFYTPPPSSQPGQGACSGQTSLLADLQKAWLDNMSFLLEDLKWVLQLPHHRFWSQVVYDVGFHECLDSFLRHAPRYFDPVDPSLTQPINEMLQLLFRRIFCVYVRMGTYKESKSAHITPSVFGEMIYDNFVFDIPKLMDLSVLYYHANSTLLNKLICNVFKHQPRYEEDLLESVPTIVQSFDNVQSHLGLEVEGEYETVPKLIDDDEVPKHICILEWPELQDVVFYLLDISTTLSAFLEVYLPACKLFHSQGILLRISAFYDTVIPAIQEELKVRLRHSDLKPDVENALKKLVYVKSSLLKIFRSVILACCVQPILDASLENRSDEVVVCIDEFLQIIMSALSEKAFISDYQKKYPLEDDVDIIVQTDVEFDPTRIQYILEGIRATMDEESESLSKVMYKVNETADAFSKKAHNGWEAEEGGFGEGACAAPSISGVELDSLISQVKDLLPHLGDGFVEACLDYYNYKVEPVINAVLEDTLTPALSQLDKNMPRTSRAAPLVEEKARAKKKDDEALPMPSVLSARANVFDGDEFDVFNRMTVDESKVHKGKKNTSNAKLLDDKSTRQNLKQVYEKYSVVVDEVIGYAGDMYEDEYDDTYDEQTVGASEPDKNEEEDLFSIRPCVVPRVLSKDAYKKEKPTYRKYNQQSDEEESEDEKKDYRPRDTFIENPEDVRMRYEALRQQKYLNRNHGRAVKSPPDRDVKGQAKGQGQSAGVLHNRAHKEQNKSARGNHNRRAMADRKRSRGMIPS